MISATKWVPRGYAKRNPDRMDLDDSEMERISAMAKLKLSDAKQDLEEAQKEQQASNGQPETEKATADDDDLKEFNLDTYDDDEEEAGEDGDVSGEHAPLGVFNNIKALAYYEPGEEDPYMVKQDDEDDEKEELEILPTDNLILATKTEDDISYLEVYVYNEDREDDIDENGDFSPSLYVHHDVMLPSFPLCVEWFDYNGSETTTGNMAAVGTFDPEIEIWNLDIFDAVYPQAILGGQSKSGDSKVMKKKKKVRTHTEYHTDAVLSLNANKLHRNLLLSGSADTTVKLWDLNTATAAKSCEFHKGKVSSVAWNPTESTVVLSGGYDGMAIVSDLRVSDIEAQGSRKWDLKADVEGVKWAANGQEFYVATETGAIHKFDARQEAKSLWTLQAHESEITSFDVNQYVSGYMVTAASSDKQIKLWNLEGKNNGPSLILTRDLDVGKVFTVGFGPEKETLGHVSVAGSNGIVKVWDTMANKTVRKDIGSRLRKLGKTDSVQQKEIIVGVEDDAGNDDEDSDNEDNNNEEAGNEDDAMEEDVEESSSEDEVI